jgi:hypothetical protein
LKLAIKVLVRFLRGLLTNLGTPHVASDIRSILVRPRLLKNLLCTLTLSCFYYSLYGRGVKHVRYSNSPFQFGSSRLISDRSSRPRIPHLP